VRREEFTPVVSLVGGKNRRIRNPTIQKQKVCVQPSIRRTQQELARPISAGYGGGERHPSEKERTPPNSKEGLIAEKRGGRCPRDRKDCLTEGERWGVKRGRTSVTGDRPGKKGPNRQDGVAIRDVKATVKGGGRGGRGIKRPRAISYLRGSKFF